MTKFEKLQESEGKLGLSHQGIALSFIKDALNSVYINSLEVFTR